MDDLTSLKGIGKATANKLRAVGIDSFAKLGAATPDQLNAALVAGGPADWAAMIAEAAKLAPPPEQRQLTDEELRALVKSWDDARAELNAAGDAASAAQYQIDTLEAGADRAALDEALATAKDRVTAAHAMIDALQPLPDGARLLDAKKSELPDLDAMFRAEVERLAAENGTPPADIYEFARMLFAGKPRAREIASDMAVEQTPDLLSPAVRDVLTELASDRGTTLDALIADSLAALQQQERDDLVNDIDSVEQPVDLVSAFAAAHGLLDQSATITGIDLGRASLHTVTVIGPVEGRRRAGFNFNAIPQTIGVTDEQKLLLEADASLSVSLGAVAAGVAGPGQRLTPADFTFEDGTTAITVLGPAKGRRRAGFEFGAAAQTVPVDAAQLAVILSDHSLAVSPA